MIIHFYKFINNIKSSPARKNKLLLISTGIGLVLNGLIWALILLKLRPVVSHLPADQAFIPLHYNIYLGVDSYGRWEKLFLLPGAGILFWFVNSLFAAILFSKKEILSYFLSLTSTILQVFLLISTIFIVLINI
ncbi:hypothetical protein KKC32_04005 [Patescibacteria group bacterium]|nr:hypothetical protein [Patescibacteria group bacterium]